MADVSSANEIEVTSNVKECAAGEPSPVKEVCSEKPKEKGDNSIPSTSTASPVKSDDEVLKVAMQKLGAGKRSLLVLDFSEAVSSLGEACQLLGQHFGETAKECGEPYFLYGKALLDLARAEAGVIDNGLDGVPEEEDADDSQVEDPEKCTDEEKVEIIEKVGEALEENFTECEKIKADKEKKDKPQNGDVEMSNGDSKDATALKTNGEVKINGHSKEDSDAKTDGDSKEEVAKTNGDSKEEIVETNGAVEKMDEDKKPDESEEQNSTEEEGDEDEAGEEEPEAEGDEEPRPKEDTESIGSNEAGPSSAKDTKDVTAIEAEEEEDPSNLQLSWEMFELAKTIFTKHLESLEESSSLRSELESKLSETLQYLGEVSIENEDYKQAVEDLTTCLTRRQKNLPEDSRSIAETHYQLGVALGFNLQFDEAVLALNDAINVLQKRIENLKNKTESKDGSKSEDAFYTREKEIAEIEGLLPEITEKINDTKDMKEETIKKLGDKRMFEEGLKVEAEKATPAVEAATTSEITSVANGDSSKTTTSISHLVKKRKKSDEPAEVVTNGTNGEAAKKPHIENEAATTNGHSNGN